MAAKRKPATNAARKRKRTAPDWASKFLRELSKGGIIGAAAKLAQIDRANVYRRRDSDPEFAALMADALEDSDDRVEATARTLANEGSERMLIFFLEKRRYPKSSTVEHKHTGEVKAGISEKLEQRLAPYEHIIRTFFGGSGAVRPDGPPQPVDSPQANPQASAIPPP